MGRFVRAAIRLAEPKNIPRSLALVVGAAAHNRLARTQRPADRRHGVERVEAKGKRRREGSACRAEAMVGLQVQRCPFGLWQRPGRGIAPTAAVIEPSLGVAPPGSAAHHKDAHRRLGVDAVGDALDPAVEPDAAQGEEMFGKIAVDWRRSTKIDLARIAQRAVAMRPRPEDQPVRRPPALRQSEIIVDRGSSIRIVYHPERCTIGMSASCPNTLRHKGRAASKTRRRAPCDHCSNR